MQQLGRKFIIPLDFFKNYRIISLDFFKKRKIICLENF